MIVNPHWSNNFTICLQCPGGCVNFAFQQKWIAPLLSLFGFTRRLQCSILTPRSTPHSAVHLPSKCFSVTWRDITSHETGIWFLAVQIDGKALGMSFDKDIFSNQSLELATQDANRKGAVYEPVSKLFHKHLRESLTISQVSQVLGRDIFSQPARSLGLNYETKCSHQTLGKLTLCSFWPQLMCQIGNKLSCQCMHLPLLRAKW